jgi:Protein of unknown function (DUF3710)
VSWFGKRRDKDAPLEDADEVYDDDRLDGELEDVDDLDERGAVAEGGGSGVVAGKRPRPEGTGPWDAADVGDPAAGGRIDLGGVWVPGAEGLEIRVEADQQTGEVIAVTLVVEDGALQLQPFAAPRSEGIWDEVRAEIRAGVTQQGGTADEVEGPLGPELRTKVPVRAQDGSSGVQPARFLGIDGPRWFLRAVITGRPAVEDGADEVLLRLFQDVVVVRGSAPMAPRDPIPLRLPADPADADGEDATEPGHDPLNPFARGPEITEIR